MKIGCQDHDISKWLTFSDYEISIMSEKALEFWTTWKPIIEAVAKQFPITDLTQLYLVEDRIDANQEA